MTLNYGTGDETVDDAIESLIQLAGGSPQADLVKEILVTVLRAVDDRMDRAEFKLFNTALKELRYSFRIFAEYKRIHKVAMFGSARVAESTPEYRQAFEFGHLITRHGFMMVTGAGDGIMKAGHAGAGKERSFGVNIRLPFEQKANTVIVNDPKLINFKYFFTRKLIFVKESDAVVLCPGGFGTMDEGFECLTLVQTGKSNPVPSVLMQPPGSDYWSAWDQFVRKQLLGRGLISPDDLSLYRTVESPEAACEEVLRFYRRYHSSRYVRERLVIRMQRPLAPEGVESLNAEFADLLVDGKIEQGAALPEEAGDQDLAALPRLTMHFHRRSFGRLRLLIDRINDLP